MANYVIGVDLGQVFDHSALSVVERLVDTKGEEDLAGITIRDHHHVRFIKRWDLGTKYEAVVKETGELMQRGLEEAVLVIDATGVGKEVVELFLQAYRLGKLGKYWPRGYVITGGRDVTFEVVPKRELVGKMQTLLQGGRLKIADALPEAPILKRELLQFRVKTSKGGQDTFEAARERDHDDIVLAVALACWFRHNLTQPRWIEGEQRGEQVRYR